MSTEITEFSPASEVVTACLDTTSDSDERITGPLVIGHYPISAGEPVEVWIERENQRVQFYAADIPAIVKQLKRTARIASEMAKD